MLDILVVFITLKLFGAVTWSWWIVLIPLWIDLITSAIAAVYELFFNWFEEMTLN